jgi:hypothetical protein
VREITVAELRLITETLFEHLEDSGHATIVIDKDYYWNIAADGRYDPVRRPAELDLGQLSDDWAELQNVVAGRRPPLNYALVWLAAILRRIGEIADA